MEALIAKADTEKRSLTDEEVTQYEGFETQLAQAKKDVEIRSRHNAYKSVSIQPKPLTANAKGDEVLERAFNDYLKTGMANADLVELRAQGSGSTAGGYTIPAGFGNKLIEVQKSFGGVRSVAEVITTAQGNSLSYPTNDDTSNSGSITAESANFANGADLVFGHVTLGAFKYTSQGAGSNLPLRVPVELAQDSAFDIGGLVAKKLGMRIARKQARDFAVGAGTTEPVGIMTTTSDSIKNAAVVNYAALNATLHDVDPIYRENGTWLFNDATLEVLEALVDGQSRPLLLSNSNSGIASRVGQGTLLGHPYVIDQGIVTASGTNYIAFGDMNEAYIIRDVAGVTVVANPYSRAEFGEIEYTAWARSDATIKNRSAYATVKDATP